MTTDTAKGTTTTETKLTDSDGNTLEVKEEVVKNDDGTTTTTTTATETDKDDKVVANTETVTEANADGEVTGSTSTYTDADGNTSTTDSGDTPEPTPEPTPAPTPGGGGGGTPADMTAPAIISMEYDPSGDTDGVITVKFDEAIKVVDGVTLPTGVTVPGQTVQSATVSGDTLTVTLTGKAAPASELAVNIVANTIQDASGNKAGALVSDTYTVPADSSDLHASVASNYLVFEGTAADDNALTVQDTDGAGALTLTGTMVMDGATTTQLTTATATAGVNLSQASIPGGVAVTAQSAYKSGYEIKASSLSDVDIALTTGADTLTVDGTVANTTVSGTLTDTDAISGTFKLASGLEVTKGSVAYDATNTKLAISGADDAAYSGDLGVVDGLTTLAITTPGTAALDLSSVGGIAEGKIQSLTLAGGKVTLSADQLAALSTVTASAASTITVNGAATVDAALLSTANLTLEVGKGSTINVSGDTAQLPASLSENFTTLNFDKTGNQEVTMKGAQFAAFSSITGAEAGDSIELDDNKLVLTSDASTALTAFDGTLTATNGTLIVPDATATISDAVATKLGTSFTKLDLTKDATGATKAESNTVTMSSDLFAKFTAGIDADTYVPADPSTDPATVEVKDTVVVTNGTTKAVNVSQAGNAVIDLTDTGWSTTALPEVTFGANVHVKMAADVYNTAADTAATYLKSVAATDTIEIAAAITTEGALKGSAATIQLADSANSVTLTAVSNTGVTVKAGSAGDTFVSSAKDDTITLGDGADTVKFAATNGEDTINEFTSGASKDVLDFSAFVGDSETAKVFSGALTDASEIQDGTTPLQLTTVTATGATNVDNGIFFATAADAAAAKGLFNDSADNKFTVTANTGHAVVLGVTGTDLTTVTSITAYDVTYDGADFTATKIATIGVDAGTADDFVAANVGVAIAGA